MTSTINMFSNLNYLTKNGTEQSTPSLKQGSKFKKCQTNLEGFDGINYDDLNLDPDGLTRQSLKISRTQDQSSQQDTIASLRKQYQDTKAQYEQILTDIHGRTKGYLDRVNPQNPYLGKNLQFSSGEVAYVTQHGVAKLYPKENMDIINNTLGKNGCPSGTVSISLPWLSDYNMPGVTIPTVPPLISGTPMQKGQTCGNEGKNVYVSSLVKNLESSYIDCYNNSPVQTQVVFSPKIGSSNRINGFTASASSVYNNNNNFTGPWRAFDGNKNTWWHSSERRQFSYNGNSGVYRGDTSVSFTSSAGNNQIIKGEFLRLDFSTLEPVPLTKYSIEGRHGCCGEPNGRDPNTWYVLGHNSKSGDNNWYVVDYQENVSFNDEIKTFRPQNYNPYNSYMIVITVCGDARAPGGQRSAVQITKWELYTGSNVDSGSGDSAMSNVGQLTLDQCQSYALSSGNKYFGIQDVDSNGIGNCMVSNDLAGSQQYGNASVYKKTPIWSSNTAGQSGTMANLTNAGSLAVVNSAGQAIFTTPGDKNSVGYIGCYGDTTDRAMPNTSNDQYLPFEQCQKLATDNGLTYFATQYAQGDNAWCAGSNDINSVKKYGIANNCRKDSKGNMVGAAWSNAVYSTGIISSFLILQDDGNMVIYLGTSPSDKQDVIWKSDTNGKQNQPNPDFAASKGKNGQNWFSTGFTLAANEFIGSNDGSIFLMMQTDGNLVLYTSSLISGCSSQNGSFVGSQNVNALYQIKNMGSKGDLGKLAYIDEDAQLHNYPGNKTQYGNIYSKISGSDNVGNDIPGASYGNSTVDACQTTCNNNADCGGFSFTNTNVCTPKDKNMYPNRNITANNTTDLYVRSKKPVSPPLGASFIVRNVDTVDYQNYVNGGGLAEEYGLANATHLQKQQLQQLQTQMDLISNQMKKLTNKFGTGSLLSENQMQKNLEGLGNMGNYLTQLDETKTKIKNFSTNMDNILDDSNISVLQKNYDYLFWTILAAGTVLVSMNIVKK